MVEKRTVHKLKKRGYAVAEIRIAGYARHVILLPFMIISYQARNTMGLQTTEKQLKDEG